MADREFDAETVVSLERVSKLLTLAARNPNQNEAAAATAKAQALLASLNLDMAAVEAITGKEGKRADELLKGGRYIWQRDLWGSVADLNFCFHWSQDEFVADGKGRYLREINGKKVSGRYEAHHRLVGRVVNIQATRVMAEYLESAIERLTRERCAQGQISARSDWAYTYRRGLSDQVILAIYKRRKEQLSEETRRKREAEEAAIAASKSSVSIATALTLASYVDREHDANADFVFGAGTSARWAAERAAKAKADAEAEAEYVCWAAAHPKQAKAAAEKREREEDARRERSNQRRQGKGGEAAYWMGREAGKAISLEPQAAGPQVSGLISHTQEPGNA